MEEEKRKQVGLEPGTEQREQGRWWCSHKR
jgi:hypothetical protein